MIPTSNVYVRVAPHRKENTHTHTHREIAAGGGSDGAAIICLSVRLEEPVIILLD